MKSIFKYAEEKTGIGIQSLKALDAVSEWFEYENWTAKDGVLYLGNAKVKKDIQLSGRKTIREGTEFAKVGLTPSKQILLFREGEEAPSRRIMKHPLNEDAFPVVAMTYPVRPVIWNDGRVDGEFFPCGDINGVMRDCLVMVSRIRERLGSLSVEQAETLVKGLGSTFEEQVLREIFREMCKVHQFPMHFGLR